MARMDQNTANVAIAAIPAIVELVKLFHAHAHPDDPPLTSEQALVQLQQAVIESLRKDDAIDAKIASAGELGVHAGSTGE